MGTSCQGGGNAGFSGQAGSHPCCVSSDETRVCCWGAESRDGHVRAGCGDSRRPGSWPGLRPEFDPGRLVSQLWAFTPESVRCGRYTRGCLRDPSAPRSRGSLKATALVARPLPVTLRAVER